LSFRFREADRRIRRHGAAALWAHDQRVDVQLQDNIGMRLGKSGGLIFPLNIM
jgi:hypothetical protein